MSKSIMIPEGGIARGFTADKLRVPLEAGGYELLVPESTVGLGELRATVNRRYRPGEDGLFAYSVVKADVPEGRSVTGKGPDGKKYKVTVDDGGNIVETPESAGDPVRIAVTTPPTNPYGIYQDGQTITTDGMVVTAYDNNDDVWGIVPINDITISPTTAVYDASTDEKYTAVAFGNIGGQNVRIPLYNFATYDNSDVNTIYEYDYFPLTIAYCVDKEGESDKHPAHILASKTSGTYTYYSIYRPTGRMTERTDNFNTEYTYNGQTVYYSGMMHTQMSLEKARASYDIPITEYNISRQQIAWLMIYGTITPHQPGSRQQITVTWPRPGDGTILETTFVILVAPGYTPGGEE